MLANLRIDAFQPRALARFAYVSLGAKESWHARFAILFVSTFDLVFVMRLT